MFTTDSGIFMPFLSGITYTAFATNCVKEALTMNKILRKLGLFTVAQTQEPAKTAPKTSAEAVCDEVNFDLYEPVNKSILKRLPWLLFLLLLGTGVSATVGLFESIVAHLPVIMCFQSLILDMAGNVGTQSLAVAIRVLADENLSGRKKASLIFKECRIGFINGAILGILSFAAIGGYLCLTGNGPFLAFSVSGCLGTSMIAAMAISAFAGTVIPLFFQKIGVDPAVASGPLITTINDLVAVITYYGLSWLILINIMHI